MVASGVFIDTYVSVAKLLPYSERQRFIPILTLSITFLVSSSQEQECYVLSPGSMP